MLVTISLLNLLIGNKNIMIIVLLVYVLISINGGTRQISLTYNN